MSRMKRYQNPDLYEQLAAAYAMGSLKGRARTRFEALMRERPYIKYSVDQWEDRFHSLNQALPEEKPSAQVWKNINQAISPQAPEQQARASSQAQVKPSLFERLGFWQAATGLMSVALAAVLMLPRGNVPNVPIAAATVEVDVASYKPSFVSVLASNNDKPMMYTRGLREKGVVEVRMAEMPKIPDNEDWVLWAMPRSGGAPMPVGTLTRDSMQTQIVLTEEQWQQKMIGTHTLGVTSEPRHRDSGPNPRMTPSGEIIYKGKCLEFI